MSTPAKPARLWRLKIAHFDAQCRALGLRFGTAGSAAEASDFIANGLVVSPHPIAVAADVDQGAMMQDAVDERRRHHVIAEHLAPFLEALVRGQHRWC